MSKWFHMILLEALFLEFKIHFFTDVAVAKMDFCFLLLASCQNTDF